MIYILPYINLKTILLFSDADPESEVMSRMHMRSPIRQVAPLCHTASLSAVLAQKNLEPYVFKVHICCEYLCLYVLYDFILSQSLHLFYLSAIIYVYQVKKTQAWLWGWLCTFTVIAVKKGRGPCSFYRSQHYICTQTFCVYLKTTPCNNLPATDKPPTPIVVTLIVSSLILTINKWHLPHCAFISMWFVYIEIYAS